MGKKEKEIEIKLQIENSKPLVKFLEEKGKFISEKKQEDEYFSPAHKEFLEASPVREWLRLRKEDGESYMNYKNWHHSDLNEGLYADEYEVKIDNVEQARKIFSALNFKSLTKIKKERKTWDYKDYEIVFDSVEELGDFIEIEYKGDEEDHEEIVREITKFAKGLELGEVKRVHAGYPYLLLFPEDTKFESI